MIKLYFDFLSQPSRSVYIFLKKTKIPFEECYVDLFKGEHKKEEFKSVHPFHQLPAINDGGFKVFESVAALRYLTNTYPDNVADHWYPRDLKLRARIDEYTQWQHLNTRLDCAFYVNHLTLFPAVTGRPVKQSSVDKYKAGILTILDKLEQHWLKDRKFFGGDQISIADILAVTELQETAMGGFSCFEDRPVLSEWLQLVKEQLNPELDQANVKLNLMAESLGHPTI